MDSPPQQHAWFLPRPGLQDLFDALRAAGYRLSGPQIKEGVIVFDEISNCAQLPQGVRDAQAPGEYRLRQNDSPRQFAWANGPQALKPLLFAPREVLWRAQQDGHGKLQFHPLKPDPRPLAVVGARACDIAAMQVQDRVFLCGPHPDPYYAARRNNLFVVAVHCSHPATTCFCASTGDGPQAVQGFDIALAELDQGFVVETGTEAGAAMVAGLHLKAATAAQTGAAQAESERAAAVQTRRLPEGALRDRLFAALDHPRWDEVAARCLSCGNCTMVCPTCFCHSQSEQPALDGAHSEHTREWDSCFTQGHSYIHGLTLRPDTRSRYRQWLTHKLASWWDQFDSSGCVGCGRCITWCPAGIDITAEARAVAGEDDG
ncbi:MAG TPA: sulfite reductase subunit A [Gammaproteobacteria bacterium]|nr:sulfite reductase subunit A [Gammaproteobacteria bacterium]